MTPREARPRSERLRALGIHGSTVSGTASSDYLALKAAFSSHAADSDIHVTAEEKAAWDLVASLFGVDANGDIYPKDNRGFWTNSFLSARGADAEAGGGGGLDVTAMWAALAAGTSEQINASHIPELSISKISGLQDALDRKLSAITGDMVESVLTGTVTSHNHDGMYAPLSGGVIPSQYLPSYVDDVLEYTSKSAFPSSGEAGKIYVALDTNLTYRWGGSSYVEISPSLALGYTSSTAYPGNEGAANASAIATLRGYFTGGAANKVAHALTISYDGGTAVKFDGSTALSVTIPSDAQRARWDKICALFDVDDNGDVHVTGNRGFWSPTFLSSRGSDPEAGQGGTGGLDIDAMWDALATSGAQKIDASHIPALGLLSGTVSNAQLANSSITVAGVEVPLGSAVTAAQIAAALTGAGYKLTDTTYGLATDTTAGLVKTGYLTQVGTKNYGVKLNSLGQMYVSVPWTDTVTTLASLGITATAAELNKLDGLTTTAAELAYVHGVTSSIQTQLNAKASASALAGYLPLTGGTMTGTLTLLVGGTNYDQGIRINRPTLADWATLTIGCVGSGTSGTTANTWLIGTPANSNSLIFCLNASSDQKGLCLRDMTNMGIRWNDYIVWHAGNHGSGSGLDADLLDGYHASSFQKSITDHYELNLTSNNTTDGKWNVLLLHEDTLSWDASSIGGRSVQGTFYFYRPSGNVVATINVNSGAGFNASWGTAAMSIMGGWNGWGQYSFVTCTYKGRCYRAIKFTSGQQVYAASFRGTIRNKDTYFGVFVPYATTSGTVLDSEVNGSIKDFAAVSETRYVGDIIAPTFKGDLSGNASSATKLATARSIWGQLFDGTQGVDGHLYLGSHAYRLYFGTSGLTSYITGENSGYFSIKSANNTSSVATLLTINLSNGLVSGSGMSLSSHLAVSGAEGRGITYTGNSIRLKASTGGWAIGIDPYHNDDTTSFSHSVGGAYGSRANTINYTYYGGTYNSPAMVILPNKTVGIGTTTTAGKFHVAGSGVFTTTLQVNQLIYALGGVQIGPASDIGWYIGNNRISAGLNIARGVNVGTLLVSNAWADYTKVPTNGIYSKGNVEVAGTIHSSTGIWSSGWLSFSDLSSTSDRRFKDGIAPLDKRNALSVIHALKPSTWTWNALAKVKGRSAGFVAQDVAGVLPDAIREIGEDKHLALNYQMLHAYEVAALQEHDDEIGRLRTRVAELERQLKEARTWQH